MPDRIIRESICTSDTLDLLSDFEERFWHRLIVNCDDFGRFDARPAVLKARLFPLRESLTFKGISDCLAKLASVGLIELYEVDGRPFLHVVTWERYQRARAKRSKFPAPGDIHHTPDHAAPSSNNRKASEASALHASDSTCCQLTANVPECESECESEYECESEDDSARAREAVPSGLSSGPGSAVSFYLDRIESRPGQQAMELLADFEQDLGPEVCIRAMMEALEAGKAKWGYIHGILKNKRRDGIRSLAAWDAHEAARKSRKTAPARSKSWTELAKEMEGGKR